MADSAPVGAGEAPRPVPPAPDGILTIRGGVGGMSYQLEELLRGAARLDDVVQQLLGIEEEARRVQDDLEPFLYDSYDTGCNAIDAVADSRKEVTRVRQDLVEVSASVRASHRDYGEAEAKNAQPRVLRLDEMRLSSPLIPPSREITHNLVTMITPLWSGSRGVIRGLLESPLVPDLRPRPVSAERMEESTEYVDPSMAESLRRLERLHARNDGEIEVIRFDNNGSASWMVLIPGTQPNSPSTNPLDIPGVGEALGYDSDQVVPAIGQALREAGAEAGDQVVAVGHSQGGVHAMNLAQNQAFLSEFDLRYVLTAGAPVGGITPEPGISSLHLEHAQDWVPGADGRMNADTKDRVTVSLTNEVRTPEGEDLGLGPGHNQENYAAGAELVALSRDESLAASTAVFTGVVGAGGMASVTRFKLERAPVSAPALAVKPDSPPTVKETKKEAGTR
ncbi:pimeloyl-ACP methyl ester carboxylesterase [Paenarthrobacter nitroguajacolicus]|uniref:hypothetical protein n=1 Tax=Paenarthrobacter nitroguajacolicus TaxID=211146 RepID=UPI00285A4A32|nr:hypothetical protein [Paenarthrobacter nitroguajacolicus]MDR6988292.1 pimeloyl-ACP methyl ester carboxylesterase [Paenarthrobacter nitroguajacolicus]